MDKSYRTPAWAQPELEERPCAFCGRPSYYELCEECETYFAMFEKITLR